MSAAPEGENPLPSTAETAARGGGPSAASGERGPFAPFLERAGFVLLDGGLATTLEAGGADLSDELWSARVLLEEPERLAGVHRAFLDAGADVLATASYQATFEGLARRGLAEGAAAEVLLRSVTLAIEARERFLADGGADPERPRPLVAASVGPYGAYLADGSEYRGDYGLSEKELRRFHERRWRLLAASDADLLGCETIPSALEADVLLALLEDTPDRWAWLSFSLRDGTHLADGTPLAPLLVELRERRPTAWRRLAAVGANCAPPSRLDAALATLLASCDRPIVLYPNSGEEWDAARRRWVGRGESWVEQAVAWHRRGARVLGGCCRTTPEQIGRLRAALESERV